MNQARLTARPESPRRVERGLLVRYRVMAFSTAALLIILVFVGIPLQLFAHRPEVVNVVGTMHGFLYIVYLFVAFQLTRKLAVPKWQMALVLLAGTVPFCAFVAERKMTRRFESAVGEPSPAPSRRRRRSLKAHATSIRKRWFSPRALLLHLEIAIVAPGCLAAGWWQATRALDGNGLSWVYSVEWPVFALLAMGGWWHLIHEDPDAYRARKLRPAGDDGGMDDTTAALPALTTELAVNNITARLATVMAALVGVEFLLGIMALFSFSFSRPSGWLPAKGEAVYVAHAVFGLLVTAGAGVFLSRVLASSRTDRVAAWMGIIGVGLAGAGGLMTEPDSLLRFLGMALMFVGPMIAGFGYLIPALLRLQHKASQSEVAGSP
jgi:integral membrane protein